MTSESISREVLAVDGAHIGIPRARSRALRRCIRDARELGGAKRHRGRRDVLFQVLAFFGSRNRHDIISLGEEPGDRELRGRDALLRGDLADAIDEPEILREVLALKAWVIAARIVGREIVGRFEGAA